MTNQYLQAFNNHFEEFIDDVVRVFPDDKEIATASNALKKMRKVNPKLIINVFIEYIQIPYGSQIMDNNIKFFLEKDYSDNLSNEILSKVNSIKGPIADMDVEEQTKVIKYLQNLCKLCELYNNIN
jgi:hypothetical protein